MLVQIFSLLLSTVVNLLAGACLVRLYMQYQRIPFQNPIGRFVMALSDWIVLPLRKLLPRMRIDLASLIAAYLIVLAELTLIWALWGRGGWGMMPVHAVFALVTMIIWALIILVLVYTVLSWVRAESYAYDMLEAMCAPLLRPFRRLIPLVGGVDLSPLALLVALQILLIVMSGAQGELLR